MNDDQLTRTLTALAGPAPDTDAAWAAVGARLAAAPTRPARGRFLVMAAAGLGVAAAIVVAVLAIAGGDDARTVTVVPADGGPSAPPPPGPTPMSGVLPSVPLVLSRGNALELWDGATNRYVSRIGSAGAGRRITEVSLAGPIVAYTLADRVTDESSVWLLDYRTDDLRQVAAVGRHPALTPDGTTLVYVRSIQEILIVDLATGAERDIGPMVPTDDARFEWSPGGTRLLMEAGGAVSIYDENADGTSAFTTLDGLHGAATWIDDTTVYAETVDGWVEYDTTTAVAEPDNSLTAPALAVAANPRGMLAALVEDDATDEDGERLNLPGADVYDVVAFDW